MYTKHSEDIIKAKREQINYLNRIIQWIRKNLFCDIDAVGLTGKHTFDLKNGIVCKVSISEDGSDCKASVSYTDDCPLKALVDNLDLSCFDNQELYQFDDFTRNRILCYDFPVIDCTTRCKDEFDSYEEFAKNVFLEEAMSKFYFAEDYEFMISYDGGAIFLLNPLECILDKIENPTLKYFVRHLVYIPETILEMKTLSINIEEEHIDLETRKQNEVRVMKVESYSVDFN